MSEFVLHWVRACHWCPVACDMGELDLCNGGSRETYLVTWGCTAEITRAKCFSRACNISWTASGCTSCSWCWLAARFIRFIREIYSTLVSWESFIMMSVRVWWVGGAVTYPAVGLAAVRECPGSKPNFAWFSHTGSGGEGTKSWPQDAYHKPVVQSHWNKNKYSRPLFGCYMTNIVVERVH